MPQCKRTYIHIVSSSAGLLSERTQCNAGQCNRQPSDRDQRLLVAAFQQTFSTLVALYQAFKESGRGQQEGQSNIFYDDELGSLSKTFAGLSSSLQSCPADCLFLPSLQPQQRIPDLIRCCVTQARTAQHALIMTLQEHVRIRPVHLSLH